MKKVLCLVLAFILILTLPGCDDNNKKLNNENDNIRNTSNNTSNGNTDKKQEENTGNDNQQTEINNNDSNINQNNKRPNNENNIPPKENIDKSNNTTIQEVPKEQIITIDATKEYYCILDDYTLEGNVCKKTATVDAFQKPSCGTNGTFNGYECVYSTKISLIKEAISACNRAGLGTQGICHSAGCSMVGGIYSSAEDNIGSMHWCYKLDSESKPAYTSYYCQDDYTYKDKKCTKIFTINANYNLTCPENYTFTGKDCIKVVSN